MTVPSLEISELIDAGCCYAILAQRQVKGQVEGGAHEPPSAFIWPWAPDRWMPSSSPIRNLEQARKYLWEALDRIYEEPT